MEINYYFEEIDIFETEKDIEKQVRQAISDEGKEVGTINYIFCSDEYLLKMNKEYLNHDYYTDIITFDYSENKLISGDIFISKERVEENAKDYNVSFTNELKRVMIHGVLHLLGFKDSDEEEKRVMRLKEDNYID